MSWANAVKKKPVVEAVQSAAVSALPPVQMAKVNISQVVTLDFETFYDDDYTLKKLSTSEYIRDKRFKALMVGIKVGKKKTKVVPHAKIKNALAEIDWTSTDLLCHHTQFDGLILSHHYGVVPRRYLCTLSMARGLHSNDIRGGLNDVAIYYDKGNKLPDVLSALKGVRDLKTTSELYKNGAEYCATDVELCHEIFLEMLAKYPQEELDLIDITVRMFCDPVLKVNRELVMQEYTREVERRRELLKDIITSHKYDEKVLLKTKAERALEGEERNILIAKRIIGSSEKFADLLRAEGIDPPMKISPAWIKAKGEERDKKEKWAYAFASTDLEFIELQGHRKQRVRDLVEARLAVKSTIAITRAQRFLNASEGNAPLPVYLAYYRAHTGRWGGGNKMNMQNLEREDPNDKDNSGLLRKSILAPKGHEIIVGDSGQIEARVNGWLWGQDDLLEEFRLGDAGLDRDVYCKFADRVYGREITKADKIERHVGKTSVLGLGFQMGAEKFQNTLAKGANGGPQVFFDLPTCQKIVAAYRKKNHRIAWGWTMCQRIIADMAAGREGSYKVLRWEKDKLWLPNGMCLHYPGLKASLDDDTGYEEWTYRSNDSRKKIYGGLLCENIVQALARIIVGGQMRAWAYQYKRRVVMMTHDENVGIARKAAAPKAFAELMTVMKIPPAWCADLPLNCEGGYAENYSK